MKFDYYIGCNEAGFLDFEVKDNEYITGYLPNISGWLSSDVQNLADYLLPKIKQILDGEISEDTFDGNAYEIVVRKDYTIISYIFEYCNPKMVPCTLPTEILYEILQIWKKAYEEHRNKQN